MNRLVLVLVVVSVGCVTCSRQRYFGGGGGGLNVGRPNGASVLPGQLGQGGYHNPQILPAPIPGFGGGNFGGGNFGGGCKRHCKDEYSGKYICCDDIKPGRCPPVRPDCPRIYGPQTCTNDLSCQGRDKCCYDTCLKDRVCKPPQNQYNY